MRNGQPDGAFRGLGMSPERTMRLFARAAFGSGSGTADKSDLEYVLSFSRKVLVKKRTIL